MLIQLTTVFRPSFSVNGLRSSQLNSWQVNDYCQQECYYQADRPEVDGKWMVGRIIQSCSIQQRRQPSLPATFTSSQELLKCRWTCKHHDEISVNTRRKHKKLQMLFYYYHIYSRISRKIYDKILSWKLGEWLIRGSKVKNFFQPPKYAVSSHVQPRDSILLCDVVPLGRGTRHCRCAATACCNLQRCSRRSPISFPSFTVSLP